LDESKRAIFGAADCGALFLDLLNPCIDGVIRHMPQESGHDAARM
jgi:hypothetical protein